MTGNRRELPRSRVAGHWPRPVPHRGLEGSPCGRAHPLLEPFLLRCSSAAARSRSPRRSRRARGRKRRRSSETACRGRPSEPAAVQPLLAAPSALDDEGVLAALAAGELVADLRPPARVPGGLDQQPADMALPTFVIEPCRRCSPEECSEGTSPTKAMNSSAERKRLKSPISTAIPSALSVSRPRRQRRRPTSTRHGPCSAASGWRVRAPRSAGRPDRRCAGRYRRCAAGRGSSKRCWDSHLRRATPQDAPAAAARAASRTWTGGAGHASDPGARPRGHAPDRERPPARAKAHGSARAARRRAGAASLRASRESVLTRSPGRVGTRPGATTAQSIPRSIRCR